jgi:phosphoglycolate phosphatase
VVSAVVLDLDGTLIDAFDGIHDALSHTMRALGFAEQPFLATKRMVGHGLEALLVRAMGPKPEVLAQAVPIYRARYAQIALSSAKPLPGAERLLRTLHGRGVGLALASNKPSYFSRQILDGLGWGAWFTSVLGPDVVGAPKPAPVMLERALSDLRARTQDAVYVGDMTVDLETARAAQVRAILVATGSMSREELVAAGADTVLDSLEALQL